MSPTLTSCRSERSWYLALARSLPLVAWLLMPLLLLLSSVESRSSSRASSIRSEAKCVTRRRPWAPATCPTGASQPRKHADDDASRLSLAASRSRRNKHATHLICEFSNTPKYQQAKGACDLDGAASLCHGPACLTDARLRRWRRRHRHQAVDQRVLQGQGSPP